MWGIGLDLRLLTSTSHYFIATTLSICKKPLIILKEIGRLGGGKGGAKGAYAIGPKSIYLDLINRRLHKRGGGGSWRGGAQPEPNKSFMFFHV